MLNPYSTIAVIVALVELFYKEPENETYFQDLGFRVWGYGAFRHQVYDLVLIKSCHHVCSCAVFLSYTEAARP